MRFFGRGVSTCVYSGLGGDVISSANPVKFSDDFRFRTAAFGAGLSAWRLKGEVDLRDDGWRTGATTAIFFVAEIGDAFPAETFNGVILGDSFGDILGDRFGDVLGDRFGVLVVSLFAGVPLGDRFGDTFVTLREVFAAGEPA